MPSYQEIMRLTGFRSKNAVFKLINRLVHAGLVEKDRQGRIAPKGYSGRPKSWELWKQASLLRQKKSFSIP